MDAEFEERQFESHLNAELPSAQHLIYVPGQVLEWRLGIDVALFARNPVFWDLFGGRLLTGRLLVRAWRELENAEHLFPQIHCNVFLQHKRPEYLTRPNSTQWRYWGRSYYRYRIVRHQHEALEALEREIGGDGIVLYSCPAFHRIVDLWENLDRATLVDNTNFAQPSLIAGHEVYTFVEPGTSGRPNPNGEQVNSYDLRERIAEIRQRNRRYDGATVFVRTTWETISPALYNSPLATLHRQMVERFTEPDMPSGARDLFSILAFCYLTRLSWAFAVDD